MDGGGGCGGLGILVPRGRDPSGLCQESRPLAVSKTGSPAIHGLFVKYDKSDWLKNTE